MMEAVNWGGKTVMEKRILLLEDDRALSRGTVLALSEADREIRTAETLAEGQAALTQGSWDLVILDLNLPDGNGLDFLTALRRESKLPVLF